MSGKTNKRDLKRKRTRSEKGIAYDEMFAEKSPKAKKEKSKVSRRIVFNNDSAESSQVNNNATVKQNKNEQEKITALKKGKTVKNVDTINQTKSVTKVIDKCFQNVWRKEQELEKKLKQVGAAKRDINPNSDQNSNLVLQGADGESQQPT